MRLTCVVVNTQHSYILEYTPSPRDQLSNVYQCLSNDNSVAENTACVVYLNSTCELLTQVCTLFSYPPYNILILNLSYCTTPDRSEWQNYDYEFHPGCARQKPDKLCKDISYESDTVVLANATSASIRQYMPYEGTPEVISDVYLFEDKSRNLCENQ